MARRSGVEQLRALIGSDATPPIGRLVGMALTDVGLADASFSMPATRWLLSPQGVISCGTLAILADGPLGCAVHSALPPATAYSTSELSLRLLRPARAGGTLVARGRLVHAGRSLALSAVQIIDGDGRLLADGSSLCFVRSMPAGREVPAPSAAPGREPVPVDGPDPYERAAAGQILAQEIWVKLSGLEILRRQIAGDLPWPPIHYLTGLRPIEVGAGEAVFALPCHEWLCSPLRTVEGGVIAMLADSALVSAIQTTAPPGAAVAAVDLKVNFLRPVRPDGRELLAHGRARHSGRTISIAEADVVNADGKTVALATGSAMVLPGRTAALDDPKFVD
ncbi:MAG: hypothetical protein QOJ89_470 [bacterium]|jgi:uncharacterized protein (TIGR00369 family)